MVPRQLDSTTWANRAISVSDRLPDPRDRNRFTADPSVTVTRTLAKVASSGSF
jgi:hypothetical protein